MRRYIDGLERKRLEDELLQLRGEISNYRQTHALSGIVSGAVGGLQNELYRCPTPSYAVADPRAPLDRVGRIAEQFVPVQFAPVRETVRINETIGYGNGYAFA